MPSFLNKIAGNAGTIVYTATETANIEYCILAGSGLGVFKVRAGNLLSGNLLLPGEKGSLTLEPADELHAYSTPRELAEMGLVIHFASEY